MKFSKDSASGDLNRNLSYELGLALVGRVVFHPR